MGEEVKSISTNEIIDEFFRRMKNLSEEESKIERQIAELQNKLTIIKTKKQQANAAYNTIIDIYRKNK